ncbi:MAG: (5-formylfuran-3-yl)methyl phosphate synthase [Pirellulaceae bacterium]|jgi:hypothetical protein|nr:(5-formylfuran-3-yl)methyl phosphate synthase [Pirellulaceae bacterium]MDP7016154.1 (5-formylfuran-3-yl)methyl phosphate synthase [Pirellulaceae bacterium]
MNKIELLVSVRNETEAERALQGGAGLIDVKEPLRGPLGAANPSVWRDVAARTAGRAPLSAALGELVEAPGCGELPGEFSYAKIGLAGGAHNPAWPRLWTNQWRDAADGLNLVLAAYADYEAAAAIAPERLIDRAGDLGCRVFLLDTFCKAAGGLFDTMPPQRVAELVERARQARLQVALAGSLRDAGIRRAAALRPDWIAVRGAACKGGRTTSVSATKVRDLRRAIDAASDSFPTTQHCRQFA